MPVFALEALRVSAGGEIPAGATWEERARATWQKLDKRALAVRYAAFSAPILCILAVCSWSNFTRFHQWSPNAFGHEYLSVAWHDRMHKWGLFGYHYLAKNLGCLLTELPWLQPSGTHAALFARAGVAPFQINEHGLAFWFTMPIYFWLLLPRQRGWLSGVLLVSVLGPLAMDLLYQNTGWRQFGYRFSNDYSPLLFVLLAVGKNPLGWRFRTAAVWGIAVNLFGAVTFDRGDARFDRFYFRDGSSGHDVPARLRSHGAHRRKTHRRPLSLACAVAVLAQSCAATVAFRRLPPGVVPESITVTSRSFSSGGAIPVDFTCDGKEHALPTSRGARRPSGRSRSWSRSTIPTPRASPFTALWIVFDVTR